MVLRLINLISTAFAFVFLCGCATVRPQLPEGTARTIASALEERSPSKFQVVHSVVVSIKPHWYWPTIRQVALGCANVDRANSSFSVVCLSPLGMKLFDITCTNGQSTGFMLVPVEGDKAAMMKAMGEAISRAFLEASPGTAATAVRDGNDIVLTGHSGSDSVNYRVSDAGELMSKEYLNDGHRLMTITYSDYQATNNLQFPHHMTIEDSRRGYSIDFKVKELSVQ